MTLMDFLKAVVPPTGNYVVVSKAPTDERLKQHLVTDFEALYSTCHFASTIVSADYWLALANYSQGWHKVNTTKGERSVLRTQANANQVRALWLDIDVGENKPYATRDEALLALTDFCKTVGMPRPWVIGSGSAGLHIYFALTECVHKNDWQYLADRLKQACRELKLHADPVRTADVASILRVPMSYNTKTNPPARVEIILDGRSEPFELYKDRLSKFVPVSAKTTNHPVRLPIPADMPSIAGASELASKYFPILKPDYPTRDPLDVVAGCEQMRLQKGASEPVWRGMLATIRHCEHGRHVAHRLSMQDERYNADITDEKLDYLETNDISPYTCETFMQLRPEVCRRCSYNGLYRSPISLPNRIPTVQVSEPAVAVAVDSQPAEPTEPVVEIPTIETDNYVLNDKGCFARVVSKSGDSYWEKFYPYPVYPIQRVKGRTDRGDTIISYIFRKHNAVSYTDIQLEGAVLMGTTLNATLGNFGFLLSDKERKQMAGFMIDMLKETEQTIKETETSDNLGWNESRDSFLLGNKIYRDDGQVIDVNVNGKAKVFSKFTKPKGSLDVWKQIANVYNKDGLEWGQLAVVSAFASPIMCLGALERSAVMFIKGDKGIGKSTALKLAISVYGDSEHLMINKDDTYLARINKLGIMNSIAVGFDEMTDLSPKEASELAYQITQGRGKDRMASGGENMVMNTTYWSCLPVMTANDSIINALSMHGLDATAQMSRVLELEAVNINQFYTTAEMEKNEQLVRQLGGHYGVAGDIYIRYVTTHKAEIINLIQEIEKRFKEHSKLDNSWRFWTYMSTRLIVGAMIAKQLGLIDYNIAKLFAYLVKASIKARTDVGEHEFRPDNLVHDFLNDNLGNRIVVRSKRRPKGLPDDPNLGVVNDLKYVTMPPVAGRSINVRIELQEQHCSISLKAIKEWCRERKVPPAIFLEQIRNTFTIVKDKTSRDLGASTHYRNAGRHECVVFEMTDVFKREHEIDELEKLTGE